MCLADTTRAVPTATRHSAVGTIEQTPPSHFMRIAQPSTSLTLSHPPDVFHVIIDMLELPFPLRHLRRLCAKMFAVVSLFAQIQSAVFLPSHLRPVFIAYTTSLWAYRARQLPKARPPSFRSLQITPQSRYYSQNAGQFIRPHFFICRFRLDRTLPAPQSNLNLPAPHVYSPPSTPWLP